MSFLKASQLTSTVQNVCLTLAVAWVLLALGLAFPHSASAVTEQNAGGNSHSIQAASTASASDCLQVKSYAINAKLNTKKNTLDTTAIIAVKNNTGKAFEHVYLRNMAYTLLAQARDDTYINDDVKSRIVVVRNISAKKNLSYSLRKKDRSIVRVKLGKAALRPGKTMHLEVKTITDVPNHVGRFGYQKNSQGKLFILAWCYPYLADYRAGKWNLSPFPLYAENRFSRATKYKVVIRAPKAYKVATSGISKTKNGVTTVKATRLRDFAAVACDYMKKDVSNACGVKITNWYLPKGCSLQYRKDVMLSAKDAVSNLTARVGKLPYDEIDLVQVLCGHHGFYTGSMEYPGLITLRGEEYYEAKSDGDISAGRISSSVYHEVAHQWFFATVGNDEYREPWLDEGFASYFAKWARWENPGETMRYLADAAGVSVDEYLEGQRRSARNGLAGSENGAASVKLNTSVSKLGYTAYYRLAYSVSAWFLLQLEDAVGQEAFYAIMRDYYATYRQKEATTQGFISIVRKHASGSEVNRLIAKYFR